jgi:hypothetical protein
VKKEAFKNAVPRTGDRMDDDFMGLMGSGGGAGLGFSEYELSVSEI